MRRYCQNCDSARKFTLTPIADGEKIGDTETRDETLYYCATCGRGYPVGDLMADAESQPTQNLDDRRRSTWVSADWNNDISIASAPNSEPLVEPPTDENKQPLRIGRFRILAKIGEGGYGVVYKAHDAILDKPVAIKMPRNDASRQVPIDKLVAEAQSLDDLIHPNVITLKEVGQTEQGQVYVVMRWVEGQDLVTYVRDQRLNDIEKAKLVATIARALHYIHQQQYTHRDLKPANILVETATGQPFILDLGLAVHESEQANLKNQVTGTPLYMSPEQVAGKVHHMDGRTDLWSLGVILYELLAGRRPFSGDRFAVMEQIQQRDVRPIQQFRDDLPAQLDAICLRLLSREPAHRYPSGKALADDLDEFVALSQSGISTSLGPEHSPQQAPTNEQNSRAGARQRSRVRPLAVVVGLAATVAIVLTSWFYYSRLERPGRVRRVNNDPTAKTRIVSGDLEVTSAKGTFIRFAEIPRNGDCEISFKVRRPVAGAEFAVCFGGSFEDNSVQLINLNGSNRINRYYGTIEPAGRGFVYQAVVGKEFQLPAAEEIMIRLYFREGNLLTANYNNDSLHAVLPTGDDTKVVARTHGLIGVFVQGGHEIQVSNLVFNGQRYEFTNY